MENLLSIEETSRFLNVPKTTLDYWRWQKPDHGPKFIKIGKFVRYQKEDIENFIKKSRPKFGPGG